MQEEPDKAEVENEASEDESPHPKARNLKSDEKKKVILGFVEILKNIQVNNKPLVVQATSRNINTNPDISIEEIKDVFKVPENSKVDFIRQLYIRSGLKILKEVFPDEEIINIPTLSFTEEGNSISLNF